ncbi:hypothetical protein PG999_004961 [Apiospora kogelbergensis]|uniref:Uncharacterized protein n=1 Tax=Apiospora kogelbergensis TaxID=1337665 RepID=A0AAW0R0V6_9PEZI
MRFVTALGVVFAGLHGISAGPTGLQVRDKNQPDSQTMKSFEQTGHCMNYYTGKKAYPNKGMEPCVKYCEAHGGHGYVGCDVGQFSGTAEEVDKKAKSQGLPPAKDDDGNPWLPGKCKCEDKGLEAFADELINVVARALSKLDNVICAVLVSAFKEIAEIGLEFVPGGSSVKVAKAIKYAKSAYQNGMKAEEFYTDWVGQACCVPGWNFNLEQQFTDLALAPSEMMEGKSTGCVRKDKDKCKKVDEKKNLNTGDKIHKGKKEGGKKRADKKGGGKGKKKPGSKDDEELKSCNRKRDYLVPSGWVSY